MSHAYTMIVITGPAEGREDEYNDWYDKIHLPEFLALPGVVSGRRFKVVAAEKPAYAAIYELTEAPDTVMGAMRAEIMNGTMRMSDALDMSLTSITKLEPR